MIFRLYVHLLLLASRSLYASLGWRRCGGYPVLKQQAPFEIALVSTYLGLQTITQALCKPFLQPFTLGSRGPATLAAGTHSVPLSSEMNTSKVKSDLGRGMPPRAKE